ncbi:MAG: GNAT family N-acetyltransferase [Mycobacterium sp.]|nr:GNAT family N-acetyltransferase [Mycobacterium sp.]
MLEFSPVITDYWRTSFSGKMLHSNKYMTIVINPDLSDDERVTVLWTAADDRISIAVTPAVAEPLAKDIAALDNPSETDIRTALASQGVVLHDADNIFYLTESATEELLRDAGSTNVRQLTDSDADMFASFKAAVSEQDWDDASVELDHWAAFGAFDDHERLVSIGSMYPWDNEFPLADIGVLTLGSARGRGYAKALASGMFRYVLIEGYEPQYRCQLDNAASIKLASSLDLQLFGRWKTITPDDQ